MGDLFGCAVVVGLGGPSINVDYFFKDEVVLFFDCLLFAWVRRKILFWVYLCAR